MKEQKSGFKTMVTSVALGLVAGAVGGLVAGVLLAPKSRETLAELKQKSRRMRNQALDRVHDLKERGENMAQNMADGKRNDHTLSFIDEENDQEPNPLLGNKKSELLNKMKQVADFDKDIMDIQ